MASQHNVAGLIRITRTRTGIQLEHYGFGSRSCMFKIQGLRFFAAVIYNSLQKCSATGGSSYTAVTRSLGGSALCMRVLHSNSAVCMQEGSKPS